MNLKSVIVVLLFLFLSAVAHSANAQTDSECGLLVMAHGGDDDWNAAIEVAVAPLQEEQPTALAFGMADPVTLSSAANRLATHGVDCITVVRLFMSSSSFLHQTAYLFGLRSDPPRFFMRHEPATSHDSSHQGTPAQLQVGATVRLNPEGLLDAPEMGGVLARRAIDLSDGFGAESVLIIAHGPGDDDENIQWLQKLDRLADSVRATGRFTSVSVKTLREDWDEKRVEAENQIRSFVQTRSSAGDRVLVIPFRLFGFGPYHEVLRDLTYHSNDLGLLPGVAVTNWVRDQATKTEHVVDAGGSPR